MLTLKSTFLDKNRGGLENRLESDVITGAINSSSTTDYGINSGIFLRGCVYTVFNSLKVAMGTLFLARWTVVFSEC